MTTPANSTSSTTTCESCGMTMATAEDHAPDHPDSAYCAHCSAADGSLQSFDERFERMLQWEMRRNGQDRVAAEAATRAYMRGMPAWRNHPQLQEQA